MSRQDIAPVQPPVPVVKDELCGVKSSDLVRVGDETVDQHVARVTEPAIARWKEALAASDDPRRQAMALSLASVQLKQLKNRQPGEPASGDTPANNSLVLLAMETDDPAIYALAIAHCRGDGLYEMAPGPCAGLSFEHWATIDSNNAIPWLWIAARADHAGDQQGVDDALAKASAATGTEAPEAALSALAMGALPGGANPLEKAVAGIEAMMSLPGGAPLAIMDICSETAIQRPLRKEQCSAVTTNLAKQGRTLIDQGLASSLADRLGFPEDIRAALRTEARAARRALNRGVPNLWGIPEAGFGCATVLGYDVYLDTIRAARGNERAALGLVARSMEGAR